MFVIEENYINNLELNPVEIIRTISNDLDIPVAKVNATVNLLKEGNTIPFISRYRKEITGNLTETEIREISHKLSYYENLESRRIEIIKSIFNQGKLTEELLMNINKCNSLTELEDIYAPYKKKKKTRGMIAIEKGLEPLAEFILISKKEDILKEAEKYINVEKNVNNVDEALQGAMDIIAEKMSQDIEIRRIIKDFIISNGTIVVKGLKDANVSEYKIYYDYKESLKTIKPHRILAINRGEREEELETKLDYDDKKIFNIVIERYKNKNEYIEKSILDGLKRLLLPSIEREIRNDLTEVADKHGISVFAENLRNLLMTPPIKRTKVMGIDPGIRTGSKVAIIDNTGKYLDSFVIYQHEKEKSMDMIAAYAEKYKIELIAIGNGTGSHEVQEVVAAAIEKYKMPVEFTVVSEDGASVYSASEIGVMEFPDLDVTVRGAISLGRRLQDPLAELVKIDPKSIGVGLYQHDVDQKALSKALDEVVESVVNNVGVDLNTASFSLLKYVSGITTTIAKNIVSFREKIGAFKSREDLKKVPGFGEKTFEQAAGFLKVPESSNPLDNTWVHPENYPVAKEIYDLLNMNKDINKSTKEELMKKYNITLATIDEIINELKKPNRDPREDYPKPVLQKGVISFEDLKEGMKVTGKIKNVVDFGAFVDIGIKETALVHISELSDNYVDNPMSVIKVGDIKEFTIIEIDPLRKRIGLSLKKSPVIGAANRSKMTKNNNEKNNSKVGVNNNIKIRLNNIILK